MKELKKKLKRALTPYHIATIICLIVLITSLCIILKPETKKTPSGITIVSSKTKENEEVYLYRTAGENKSFEENYQEMMKKQAQYTGEKQWKRIDVLNIPFIKVSDEINYDELCGRMIKGTNWYIRQAIQTIDFELNNYGGSVKSEALIEALKEAVFEKGREFIYNDDFILYLKEEDKDKPYFALKVDGTDILVSAEEN
mgnify:CR=1 FL=1